jgi:hypothetical protein
MVLPLKKKVKKKAILSRKTQEGKSKTVKRAHDRYSGSMCGLLRTRH